MGGTNRKEKHIKKEIETQEIGSSYEIWCSVIGNPGVGKSSLINHYVSGSFEENSLTSQTDYSWAKKKNIKIGDKTIQLTIYDVYDHTANLIFSFIPKAFIFYVVDVTNRRSFDDLEF